MNLLPKMRTPGFSLLTIIMVVGVMSFPTAGMADITCCIAQNGAPCVNVCYVTDLTCADITIGFLITSCTDMINGGGGGGGAGGLLENINVLYDGQVNIGNGPFPGTVDLISTELTQFLVTRPVSPHGSLDQSVQVLGVTGVGDVYVTDVPIAGLDRFDSGDLVIQATQGGMEITGPLDGSSSGRMAGGDVTLSVSLIDRSSSKTVISTIDTPVNYSDYPWTYVGDGAV